MPPKGRATGAKAVGGGGGGMTFGVLAVVAAGFRIKGVSLSTGAGIVVASGGGTGAGTGATGSEGVEAAAG